jgi:1,4-dihydroxy-2-naphthoate octaprenyltransferase
VIKDMKQDQKSGIQGLPQRLGTKYSILVAVGLIALGMMVVLKYYVAPIDFPQP